MLQFSGQGQVYPVVCRFTLPFACRTQESIGGDGPDFALQGAVTLEWKSSELDPGGGADLYPADVLRADFCGNFQRAVQRHQSDKCFSLPHCGTAGKRSNFIDHGFTGGAQLHVGDKLPGFAAFLLQLGDFQIQGEEFFGYAVAPFFHKSILIGQKRLPLMLLLLQ